MKEILFIVLIPLGISLLAAVLFEVFHRIKKDYQITCEALSLRKYKEKESDDVGIALSYKNERVGEALIVATFRLTNTGKKDITFTQLFEDKIQIVLKDANIIDVIVENESDKVATKIDKITHDNIEWLLSWGILKRKERITLRIVAVYQNDDCFIDTNSLSDNLSFIFRGNSIDRIESASPTPKRALRDTILILVFISIALGFLIPTDIRASFDVEANGVYYKDVDISYNHYTHSYSLKEHGEKPVKVLKMDGIHVAKQPILSEELIIVEVILGIYILLLLLYFVFYKKLSKKSVFLKLIHSLFFPHRSALLS